MKVGVGFTVGSLLAGSKHVETFFKISSSEFFRRKESYKIWTAWGINCFCFSVLFEANLLNPEVKPWRACSQWMNHMASV